MPVTFDTDLGASIQELPNRVKTPGWIAKIVPPKSFDGRVAWKTELPAVRDQGECGSCWAFAITASLEARIRIWSGMRIDPRLSPMKLLLCSGSKEPGEYGGSCPGPVEVRARTALELERQQRSGCTGSTLTDAWYFVYLYGIGTEECIGSEAIAQPLKEVTPEALLPLCSQVTGPLHDMCSNVGSIRSSAREHGRPGRSYRASAVYRLPSKNRIVGIQREILANGPVVSGMRVYDDLVRYDPRGGPYRQGTDARMLGGHAVVILGWDETSWIVMNSWGERWGEDGYFKIVKGADDCGIESSVVSALPDLFLDRQERSTRMRAYVSATPPSWRLERLRLNYGSVRSGGGIDPMSGYSRRALVYFPRLVARDPPTWKGPVRERFFAASTSDSAGPGLAAALAVAAIAVAMCIYGLYELKHRQ